MSDRIFGDRKYEQFCRSVIDGETCSFYDQYFSDWNVQLSRPIYDRNAEFLSHDIFCKKNRSRETYEGRIFDIIGHEENYNITKRDGSYICELERISSSLVKLLSDTRHKPLQEKASCDVWQQWFQLHENRQIPLFFSAESRQRVINKQCSSYSDSIYARKLHFKQEQIPLRTTRLTADNDTAQILISTSSDDCHETSSEIQGKECRKQFKNLKSDLPETSTRQKKTTHKLIERRRRNVINARIMELQNLLPDHIGRTSCKKKGSILKESIEYIKQLRQDQKRIKCLHDRICEAEITIIQLVDKFEQLESQIANNTTRNEENDAMISGSTEQSEVVTVYAEVDNVCGQESQSFRSEIAPPEQVGHDLNQTWVDISTELTSDSTMSYPIFIENGAMSYCHLA